MLEPTLCQAIVRLEGHIQSIPEGFEQPNDDLDFLFVHEMIMTPCNFAEGIVIISEDLEKIRNVLLSEDVKEKCKACLNLALEADEDYTALKFASSFLKIITDLSLELEITFSGD